PPPPESRRAGSAPRAREHDEEVAVGALEQEQRRAVTRLERAGEVLDPAHGPLAGLEDAIAPEEPRARRRTAGLDARDDQAGLLVLDPEARAQLGRELLHREPVALDPGRGPRRRRRARLLELDELDPEGPRLAPADALDRDPLA